MEVSKTGSQLSAEATYDSDGIVFKSYTKPGILKIKKETEGTTEANANDEFTFSVNLNNDKGMPIDNDVQWYKET